MSVTELVSHAEMFVLNDVAPKNMADMSVTELVSHAEMSALNAVAHLNMGSEGRISRDRVPGARRSDTRAAAGFRATSSFGSKIYARTCKTEELCD